jgi:uncharacterized membrane protein
MGIPPNALRAKGKVGETERVVSSAIGLGLVLLGLRRGGGPGLIAATGGGALILRGATGYCPMYARIKPNPAEAQVAERLGWSSASVVSRSVTIQKPRDEVYRFWHDIENLPRFMHNIESVKSLGNGRSHWVAKAPLGQNAEWDSETIEDVPGERISWKSVEGSDFNQSGTVTFKDAPGKRGTEVTFMLAYEPPLGQLGRVFAQAFRMTPTQQARQDLLSFKQMVETGELATGAATNEQRHKQEA